MNNLSDSIPSTNMKIIELYNKIDSRNLVLSPDFQRKLVWKKQHKYHFIETILKKYPFPEVYIASAEIDVSNITSSEIVVDGQQRLSTIVDYIKGAGDFASQTKIPTFDSLTIIQKKDFLNYFVSVRDLKNIDINVIKDIFMRINNTEYSLNAVEKINAQHGDGEFIVFCKQLVDKDYAPTDNDTDVILSIPLKEKIITFFEQSRFFSENDSKRMVDLQFFMTLISTLIENEYFHRNTRVFQYIEKYNSYFDKQDEVETAISNAIDMYEALNFSPASYWLTKSNAFTLFIEFSKVSPAEIDIVKLKEKLILLETESKKYFASIEVEQIPPENQRYFEFAKEAVNDKNARIYRGSHIRNLLSECKL